MLVPLLSVVLLQVAHVTYSTALLAADDSEITITLPAKIALTDLVTVISTELSVSVEYSPQRLRGEVALQLDDSYTREELWAVLNQVLAGQGFTTIIAGDTGLHQVVALGEAATLSRVQVPGDADPEGLPPGYRVVVRDLQHLSGGQAVELLTPAVGGQHSQIRTLGRDGNRLVIASLATRVAEADRLLAVVDAVGVVPAFEIFAPVNAAPQRLQQSLNAAWTAAGRVGGRAEQVDIQLMPDGRRLLLVAPAAVLARLVALAERLDAGEPIETRTYALRTFTASDVASLLQQVLADEPAGSAPRVVTNELTGGLVISGTALQHERITAFIADLESVPTADSHRELRRFPVRHRQADAMAGVLRELLAAGVGETVPDALASDPAAAGTDPANAQTIIEPIDGVPHFTIDAPSNTIIALGSPRQLEDVAGLLDLLDQRSPQLELEVVMVALSTAESQALGLELAGQFEAGGTEINLASLFGLGLGPNVPASGGGDQDAFSGLGGLVINPGDWAVLLRALDTNDQGRAVVRSQVVVDNGTEANLEAVIQEPLSEVSSNSSTATTGFGGTSDAGTQIAVTPTINAGDHVTIEFSVSQSSFLGEGTQSSDGVVLPPTRRSDSLTSVTTLPDGFVVALGGILTRRETSGVSSIPILGSIPVLGRLFRSEQSSTSDTRFYVFVRADVLRHPAFADLKHRAAESLDAAGVADDDWPALTPRFIE